LANNTQVKHRSNTNQPASETQVNEKKQQAVKAKAPDSKGSAQKSSTKKNNESPETNDRQSKAAKQKPVVKQKTIGNQRGSQQIQNNNQQKPNGGSQQFKNNNQQKQNGSSQPKASDNKNSNENRKPGSSENNQAVNKQGNPPENKRTVNNRSQSNASENKGTSNNRSQSNTSKNKGNSNNQTNNGENKSQPNKNHNAEHDQEHEVNHKEQSGKFETAFNRIHKALREMVKETESDAFVELLYSGYKNHSLIRKYKSELHQFAKLRNAIVHERVNADYYIAEPHIEVVERIEEICREFEKPQTALSIATSPVFYYYEDAYLKDVLKVINKFDFTRFPVYDKDDKYVALLTSTEIIQWMAKHFSSEVIHFEDVRIRELLTKGKNYFVTFVTEDASLYEIEELFERYHTRGKKLQAVIITETGDRHGKPIGVITPWDLLDSDPAED
jgi:CBS domain-containing protein